MSLSVKYYPVKSSLKKLKTFQINFLIQYDYYLHDNVLKVKMCSLIVIKYCNVFKKKKWLFIINVSIFSYFDWLWYLFLILQYCNKQQNVIKWNNYLFVYQPDSCIRACFSSRKLQLRSTFLNKILS